MPNRSPLASYLAPFPTPRGVRQDTVELIAKAAGGRLNRDLLFLAPHGTVDRRNRVPIAETHEGEIATIEAEVDKHFPSQRLPGGKKTPYRVRLRDESGFLSVAYFQTKGDMLQRLWPVGQKRLVSGTIGFYKGERQITH